MFACTALSVASDALAGVPGPAFSGVAPALQAGPGLRGRGSSRGGSRRPRWTAERGRPEPLTPVERRPRATVAGLAIAPMIDLLRRMPSPDFGGTWLRPRAREAAHPARQGCLGARRACVCRSDRHAVRRDGQSGPQVRNAATCLMYRRTSWSARSACIGHQEKSIYDLWRAKGRTRSWSDAQDCRESSDHCPPDRSGFRHVHPFAVTAARLGGLRGGLGEPLPAVPASRPDGPPNPGAPARR